MSDRGGSILREEREKEERLEEMPLDEHRSEVRKETDEFIDYVSPQRIRERSEDRSQRRERA